jgi:hypothetical protein
VTNPEANPLAHLRTRCAVGAGSGGSAYMAVLITTVVHPSALTLKQIIGLEFGLGIMATLCAVVAIVLWLLTQNTEIVLSVFKAASAASAANAALESELATTTGARATAIPIQRGQEIRRHRRDRHAV